MQVSDMILMWFVVGTCVSTITTTSLLGQMMFRDRKLNMFGMFIHMLFTVFLWPVVIGANGLYQRIFERLMPTPKY